MCVKKKKREKLKLFGKGVLLRGKQEGQSEIWWQYKEGAMSQGTQATQPLEVGKDKEMDSSLEPTEETMCCWPILDF